MCIHFYRVILSPGVYPKETIRDVKTKASTTRASSARGTFSGVSSFIFASSFIRVCLATHCTHTTGCQRFLPNTLACSRMKKGAVIREIGRQTLNIMPCSWRSSLPFLQCLAHAQQGRHHRATSPPRQPEFLFYF